jgi:hypothetical protein
MPKFKVELQRRNRSYDPSPYRNPFLMNINHLQGGTATVRMWEFEADDEAHVRRLLAEAIEQGLENVRGFELRSITELRENASK